MRKRTALLIITILTAGAFATGRLASQADLEHTREN